MNRDDFKPSIPTAAKGPCRNRLDAIVRYFSVVIVIKPSSTLDGIRIDVLFSLYRGVCFKLAKKILAIRKQEVASAGGIIF
jgi:hypothetical protein